MTAKRGLDSAAAIVAANDDVTHLQDIDGKLNHGKTIQVGVKNQIGDIAMDKQFPWEQVNNFIRRHPAVGTTNPKILRRLLTRKLGKKIGILLSNAGRPSLIPGKKMTQGLHICG